MAESLSFRPKTLFGWVLGRYVRFRADGASMMPTIAQGDHLFVDAKAIVEPGMVVVATHPMLSIPIVKRVEKVSFGQYWLSSDNPDEGRDSRHFGAIASSQIMGRVVAKL